MVKSITGKNKKAKKSKAKKSTKAEKTEKQKEIEEVGPLEHPLDEFLNFPEYDVVPNSSVEDIITTVNTQAKRRVLKKASEASNPFMLRRPFRVTSLDCAIGGGMAAGGITQLCAPDGIGKNALANQAIASTQYIYGEKAKIAWVWLEIPYDKQHARINNVIVPSSPDDLVFENKERRKRGLPPLNDTELAERRAELGQFLICDEGTAEERLQATLDLIADNSHHLIVVDSIASIATDDRIHKDLDETPKQAATAWLLSEFQKMVWHHYACPTDNRMNLTTVILINQVRSKQKKSKQMFEREWKQSGAHAIRHGKLLDIVLLKGGNIPEKGYPKTGKRVNFEIAKGKAGCHEGGRGEIAYHYAHGFDIYSDAVSTADGLGLLVDNGNYKDLISADGEVIESKLPWGRKGSKLMSELYTNYELFDKIYYACLEKAEASCLHKL